MIITKKKKSMIKTWFSWKLYKLNFSGGTSPLGPPPGSAPVSCKQKYKSNRSLSCKGPQSSIYIFSTCKLWNIHCRLFLSDVHLSSRSLTEEIRLFQSIDSSAATRIAYRLVMLLIGRIDFLVKRSKSVLYETNVCFKRINR